MCLMFMVACVCFDLFLLAYYYYAHLETLTIGIKDLVRDPWGWCGVRSQAWKSVRGWNNKWGWCNHHEAHEKKINGAKKIVCM